MSDKPIHGIDMPEAMARLIGNRGLLIKVISGLRDEMLDDQERFESLLGTEDFKSAAALAHRYKGVAANISATELYDHLLRCEDACKSQNVEQALEEHNQAISKIAAIFASIDE